MVVVLALEYCVCMCSRVHVCLKCANSSMVAQFR